MTAHCSAVLNFKQVFQVCLTKPAKEPLESTTTQNMPMQNPSLYVFVKFQQHLAIVAKSVMTAETPRWSVWCVDGNRVL